MEKITDRRVVNRHFVGLTAKL